MIKTYLTVQEFSAAAGVRPATVYQWITKGILRSKDFSNEGSGKRIKRARRIPQSELVRVMRRIESGLPVC